MLHTQNLGGGRHLASAHLGQTMIVHRHLSSRVQYITALTTRATDNHDLNALGHILGCGRRALT
jgi:hypothetical protein